MMRPVVTAVIAVLLGVVGACGGAEEQRVAETSTPPASDANAGPDSSILPRPFTAEQIRDEWIVGLTMTLRRKTPDGSADERWTVAAADADGAEIEIAMLDAEGAVSGEPRVERSEWIELRNHANFPADRSQREAVTRETALGKLDGWIYTINDSGGTVSELFFAQALPGAPVHMRVTRGDQLVMELSQVERSRPGS